MDVSIFPNQYVKICRENKVDYGLSGVIKFASGWVRILPGTLYLWFLSKIKILELEIVPVLHVYPSAKKMEPD